MRKEVAFVGSIPEIYDHYMGPMLFEPYARELASRFVGFSGDILETACGTGRVTRVLAQATDGGTIIATDLSDAMLAKAAEVVEDPRVSFRQADACDLAFPDDSFDAIVCQFGVMFFPDKLKAFGEAKRTLRSEGKFVFSVWDEIEKNELCQVFHEVVASCFPDDPPQFLLKGPFSYHDKGMIEDQLKRAGFNSPTFETVRLVTPSLSANNAATGLCKGSPLIAEIQERAPGREQEVVNAVESAFRARFGQQDLKPQGQAIVITATG